MAHPDDRSYRFDAAEHWAAGAMAGLRAGSGGLDLQPPRAARLVPGSAAGTIAAVGPCGRLVWLDSASGELSVLHEFGAERQGRIAAGDARAIHPGAATIWIAGADRVRRYAARTWQRLGVLHVSGLIATAADGHGGLWVLQRAGTGAAVRWVDARGRMSGPPIALRDSGRPIAIASDPPRRRLAILDVPDRTGEGRPGWRLHVVDLSRCEANEPLRFERTESEPPPAWIAADRDGSFHLVSAQAPLLLITVTADGVETFRQSVELPKPAAKARVRGLVWLGDPIVNAGDGLYRLGDAEAGSESALEARFVTPTLVSPPGTPSGWNRAELKVKLPAGTSLKATVYASGSDALARDVEDALARTAKAPSTRVKEMGALLKRAREVRVKTYRGDGGQPLHLLLDLISEPYLWLKLEFTCPAGAGHVSLESLRVRYPDRSWLDELPAIYRDEAGPAAQLRQFLAPFEALYAEIDETIDRLPARIDPVTAKDDWLSWLLGWLGFPPTEGLTAKVRRDLLNEAGILLARRGTLAALRRILEIVTEGKASVEDKGGAAGFWVVGNRLGREAPRLGRDTRTVAQRPIGFRPGTGIRLGEEPLPPFCTDIGRVLRANCARVAIRVAVDHQRRDVILPILDSLLAMFVPAHCAVDLQVDRAGGTAPGGRLDRDWRLAGVKSDGAGEIRLFDADATELGCETLAGSWQLPRAEPPPFTIDGKAALDGGRRLA